MEFRTHSKKRGNNQKPIQKIKSGDYAKNKMKKIITIALLGGLSSFVRGQEKITVGVLPVTQSSKQTSNESVAITDALTSAFVKTQRFILVDRNKMDALKQEKQLQKTEDFMDGKTIEQSKSMGAQYLISSALNSYQNDGHVCKFNLNLSVIDVASGQIISSDIIESKGGGHGGQIAGSIGGALLRTGNLAGNGSTDDAFKKALQGVEPEIEKFVSKNFPITVSIAEIQEKDSQGSATQVLIAGGSSFGIKKGDKFKVVELSELDVNGKKMQRKKEIGELQVAKVEDENFSICNVNNGGIDINTKFVAKSKIQVITKIKE